ncbi:MAG: hypothetical protein M3Q81_00050 [bacterium]|nr:hypothetical protein [bacterium]
MKNKPPFQLLKTFPTLLMLVFAFPTSTTYKLNDFAFGSGGTDNSVSETYGLNAVTGEVSAGQLEGDTYDLGTGLIFTQQANTPGQPTLENTTGNLYNRLHFLVDTGTNPSDATFAIAISSDDFVTTNYIQNDNTVGPTLGSEDYQTYADWGGAGGDEVIGLQPNVTYSIKVKAMHGRFTETGWSAVDTAATLASQLSFDIDVGDESAVNSDPPYIIDIGVLTPNTVTTGADRVWVDLATNGEGGGFVYVYGTNSGLKSTIANYTITSLNGNLAAAAEGFGLQSESVAQSSGGPLAKNSPFDGSSDVIGEVTATSQTIFNSSSQPVVGGRGGIAVKAKASTQTPAASDYIEVLTVIASAAF